ncbi:MAG: phage portal protein, partial [Planctomycetota bacterium]
RSTAPQRRVVHRTEVWTPQGYEVYVGPIASAGRGRRRIAAGVNPLGRLPVVHIQNLAQPFAYEGLSDVEPLIPLQNELNTRLSDRANRVTFQSFKMYLGKGIDGFTDRPVGPGQMWSTDNPDAAIHEFGGDAHTPSEDQHIREIREAMDKASGVSPIAAGVVGGKTGNLSSENAVRIVLLGLLARIEKKRLTYGAGIERLCELILHAADVTGVLPNTPAERRVRLDWPTPFPDSESQQLRNALAKKDLGVPESQLLAELGYADCFDHD